MGSIVDLPLRLHSQCATTDAGFAGLRGPTALDLKNLPGKKNRLQPNLNITAKQLVNLIITRYWQELRTEDRGTNRIGFLNYHLLPVLESGQRHGESESKKEGKQPQCGGLKAYDLRSRQLIVSLASSAAEPVPELCPEHHNAEQRDGDQHF